MRNRHCHWATILESRAVDNVRCSRRPSPSSAITCRSQIHDGRRLGRLVRTDLSTPRVHATTRSASIAQAAPSKWQIRAAYKVPLSTFSQSPNVLRPVTHGSSFPPDYMSLAAGQAGLFPSSWMRILFSNVEGCSRHH